MIDIDIHWVFSDNCDMVSYGCTINIGIIATVIDFLDYRWGRFFFYFAFSSTVTNIITCSFWKSNFCSGQKKSIIFSTSTGTVSFGDFFKRLFTNLILEISLGADRFRILLFGFSVIIFLAANEVTIRIISLES